MQRSTPCASVALRFSETHRSDASTALSTVLAPSLVVHAVDDPLVSFHEARRVAASIPGARLHALDTGGHALPLHREVMTLCHRAIGEFLRSSVDPLPSARPADPGLPPGTEPLSPREIEVLDLAARGLANTEIAEEMRISPRTVERHLSNVYLKLGVSGATGRVAAVAFRLRGGRFPDDR